jgi:hypothetical protein
LKKAFYSTILGGKKIFFAEESTPFSDETAVIVKQNAFIWRDDCEISKKNETHSSVFL